MAEELKIIEDAGAIDGQLSTEEKLKIKMKLWKLMQNIVRRYTAGESSSLRQETAQELLNSACFVMKIDIDGNGDEMRSLLDADFDEIYDSGMQELEEKVKYGKILWQNACLTLPKVKSRALNDTLRSIGNGIKKYDYRYFAREIPCDIDYQLCHPVSEKLMGINYVNEYLRRILVENDFLRKFNHDILDRLLKSGSKDYVNLITSIYEPAAANVVGLAILDEDVLALGITEQQQKRLLTELSKMTEKQLKDELQRAGTKLCAVMNIQNAFAAWYLKKLAYDLYPRLEAALQGGDLSGVFQPFTAE